MTLPTIFPAKYAGTVDDFLKTKVDREGAERRVTGTIAVASSTANPTVIGLVPFNKGARLTLDSQSVYIDDLDSSTNVTASIGVVYSDSTNNTDNLTLFATAQATPQTGGFIPVNAKTGVDYLTTADGWLVVNIAGGATTTTGNIYFNAGVSYDN